MLKIPLSNQLDSEEQKVLEIKQDNLPDDINKLVYLLQREKVPIGYWLQLSLLYYRNDQDKEFSQILNEALKDVDKRTNYHLFNTYDDRLQALNALASYHIILSETEQTLEGFQTLMQNATSFINDADNINQHDPITWITKCFSFLVLGQIKSVMNIVENFKSKQYTHPLAQIIKAFIEFYKGNYNESLQIYKQILLDNPRCPPSIRFAIGLCYYRIGNIDKARVAFERLVELEQDNDMAMVALSIIDSTNNIFDKQSKERSGFLLEKAFQIDQNNPLTLRYLADHYFHQKEFKISQELCVRGLEILELYRRPEYSLKENPNFRKEIEFLKSDLNYILGKILHSQEQYEKALSYYASAVKQNHNNYCAQLGLGKIYFFLHNFSAAEQCFDTILQSQKHKDSYETLRLQAQTKARQNKKNEAVEYFKRVLELNPKDCEANLEIALLFEQSEPSHALVYYENSLKIMQSNIEEKKQKHQENVLQNDRNKLQEDDIVNPELLNNIGVLRLEVGKIKEAQEAFQKAIQNSNQLLKIKGEDSRLKAIQITSRFNLAYWCEQHQKYGEATEIYKQIIQEEPSYVDAYLRLAYLAKNRGDLRRSYDYIEQAKANQVKKPEEFSKPVNQFCIKGKLLHDSGEIQQSIQEYQHVLQNITRSDSYALIGLANINYDISTQLRQDPNRQEQFLKKAMDSYINVLEHDEANCFATLGIGNILAEHGKLAESMEIYKILKESNPNMYQPLLNQAHLSMAQNNYEVAVNLYKKCLEKYFQGGRNLEIEMYLCKAYYKMNLFDTCRKLLLSLIQRHPQELKLKLNLALCLRAHANEVLNRNYRRVSETEEAIQFLIQAEKIFLAIMHQDQNMFNYLPSNISKDQREMERKEFKEIYGICDERLRYLREMIQSSKGYLEHDKKNEEQQQKQEEEKSKRLHELQSRHEKELEEKLEQEKLRIQKEQEIAERNAEEAAKIALDSLNKDKKKKTKEEQEAGQEGGLMNEDEEDFLNQLGSDINEESFNFDDEFKSEDGENELDKERKREKKLKKKEKREKREKRKHKRDKKKHRKHRSEGEVEEEQNLQEERKSDEIPNQEEEESKKLVGTKRRLIRNVELNENENETQQQPIENAQTNEQQMDVNMKQEETTN